MSAREQKAAIAELLGAECAELQLEQLFQWLVVPEVGHGGHRLLSKIHARLAALRGHTRFSTAGYGLRCDFVLPYRKIIVEYDERQHFTAARAASLRLYPADTSFGFSLDAWIQKCDATQARDNDPVYRDEQRAFYDSVRDLLAIENDFRLVRIMHGAFNWRSPMAKAQLNELL